MIERFPVRAASRRAVPLLLLALSLVPSLAIPSLADDAPPSLAAAERQLRATERVLEEIVGSELLGREVPPLPELSASALGLSADERARVKELVGTDAGSWTPEEVAWVRALARREAAGLVGLAGSGAVAEAEALPIRVLSLLPAARLSALADRAALLDGDLQVFVTGLEARFDLARRLYLQPGLVGPMAGQVLVVEALEGVRLAVGRPTTSPAALARLEAAIVAWQRAAPDAAAVLAEEALRAIELGEETGRRTGEAALGPGLLAPLAADYLELARACRRDGCPQAVAAVAAVAAATDPQGRADDHYRVLSHLMLPNLLDVVRKLDLATTLAEAARQAVALRRDAAEREGYPPDSTVLPPGPFAPAGWTEPGYRRRPDGGAELVLDRADEIAAIPADLRPPYERLLLWKLPPVAGR